MTTVLTTRPANTALAKAQAVHNAAMATLNANATRHTAASWAKAIKAIKAPYTAAVDAAMTEDATGETAPANTAPATNSDFDGQGEDGRSTPQDNPLLGHPDHVNSTPRHVEVEDTVDVKAAQEEYRQALRSIDQGLDALRDAYNTAKERFFTAKDGRKAAQQAAYRTLKAKLSAAK